MKSINRGKLA